MTKPTIAVFSGPRSTIANSPPLVTSNKGRLKGEKMLRGRLDHLVPQMLYEPVTVKIRKFTAHPLEEDAAEVYHDDGKEYYEVTLTPDDGPYPLPYMARRADGSKTGTPFEAGDLADPRTRHGGRQSFYPDASRIFTEIDRTIYGRGEDGTGSVLDKKANFQFIRALPPGGYTKKGERPGVDFFPYMPAMIERNMRTSDLATIANRVYVAMKSGRYEGGIWLEGTTSVEETLYWFNLLMDTDLPIVGCASQTAHGKVSNDGAANIIAATDYIVSGKGKGMGVVGIQDGVIFAARELKKGDDRPGGYKAVGGHGGMLGSVKHGSVTVWFRPNYKHTFQSDLRMSVLKDNVEFADMASEVRTTSVRIKNQDGTLSGEGVPRVHLVKQTSYSQEDEGGNPDHEVDIMARLEKALEDERNPDQRRPKLHGFVLEGNAPYAKGNISQVRALEIAACSGLPVVRTTRSDPGGRVMTNKNDLTIEASNLDSNKAVLLLTASMMKLGRLPRARAPRNPTDKEREAILSKISEFQQIFETH